MKERQFLLLYAVILVLDLFQVYTDGSFRIATKPMIMISLIIYFLWRKSVTPNKQHHLWNGVFTIALIAALAGELLLLSDSLFLYGLLAFLIMQIGYMFVFFRERIGRPLLIGYATLLIIVVISVSLFIWEDAGSLRWPVLIYSSAICTMSYAALSRNPRLSGHKMVFLGTILFIISDSVIALHQFNTGIDAGKLTVMITYGIAQYLIVIGMLRSVSYVQ